MPRTSERPFRRLLREERGATTIWLAFAMIPLIGFLGVAVDMGLIMSAQAQLQRAADNGSHAGVKAIRDGAPFSATSEADSIAQQNVTLVSAGGLSVTSQVGTFRPGNGTFSPGIDVANGAPAVHVELAATLPLTILPVLGLSTAQLQAEATSVGRKREVIIVQDASGSFVDEFPQARNADRALVQQMAAQGVPGDRAGLIAYGTPVQVRRPLTFLAGGGAGNVINAVNGMTCCLGGTNTGPALDQARALFSGSPPAETERVIVLVSDGVPTNQNAAVQAANQAFAQGIHIFAVHLQQQGSQGQAQMQALVRGIGQYYATANPNDLDDILLTILGALPIHLVE